MLPLTVFLSTSFVEQAAPIFTVEEVVVHRRFAGSLGSRLITELTLSSAQGKVTVTLKDARHSRFQSAEPAFKKGSRVRIPGGVDSESVSLRPDQIQTL